MTTLLWCNHCRQRTAHHDAYAPGITWANGKRVEYPDDWYEVYCSRCKTHTMRHLGEELDAILEPRYTHR